MPVKDALSEPRRYSPHIELVPVPLWGLNMRKLLPQSQWRKFRKALIERQGQQCATCGELAARLNAHEAWQYDERAAPMATLVNVSLVCWHCHHVEHWGVTKSLVAQGALTSAALQDTIDHFCRLNGVSREDFSLHEIEATKVWERRSQLSWRIDYGPFTGWVVKTFSRDPLNDIDWPKGVQGLWERKSTPSMIDIVNLLRSPS